MPFLISSLLLQRRLAAPRTIRSHLKDHVRRFSDDRNGSVAVIFALVIVSLCLFAGAGVDLGRWHHARQQTIAAMDAAVLAGGSVLQDPANTVAMAKDAAKSYYTENTKDRIDVIDDTIAFDAADEQTAFVATGNAYIKTTFLGFANVTRLPLLDASEAQFSKAIIRTGGKEDTSVEIAMMLDVTGSMRGSKITDLKKAANSLVNKVILEGKNANPVRVSIVPFAEGVRLPSSANSAARGANVVSPITIGSGRNAETYKKTDCVVERIGSNKYTDVAPGTGNYVMTLFNDNGSCGLPAADELLPLTNNKATLANKIDNLVLAGSTAGQIGTAWAWYTLSPNWNSLWTNAANKPDAYGSTRKIAILMTDGEYNLQYNSSGVSASTGANGSSTTQAREVCTSMKKKDITVYTVGFALGGNSTAKATLDHCATDASTAYTPDTGSELEQAFSDIALKINKLYLTH